MLDAVHIRGVWFLPEVPEYAVAGTLSLTPEAGPRLQLDGELFHPEVHQKNSGLTILGIGRNDEPITLGDAFGEWHPDAQVFYPTFFILGWHWNDANGIEIGTFSVSYKNLHRWCGISNLRPGGLVRGLSAEYHTSAPLKSSLVDGTTATLQLLGSSTSTESYEGSSIVISERAVLTFTFPTKRNLKSSFDLIQAIKNLITFACGIRSFPTELSLDSRDEFPLDPPRKVRVYLPLQRPADLEEVASGSDFLFTFRHFADQAGLFLSNWLQSYQRVRPMHSLFFSNLNQIGAPENRFLNLAQAAELYHRDVTKGRGVIPEEEHQQRTAEIIAATPERHVKWLTETLQFSNELRLRARLRELHEMFGELSIVELGPPKGFAHDVTEMRNSLTHRGSNQLFTIEHLHKCVRLGDQLENLLRMCLLREIGFSIEEIQKLISRWRQISGTFVVREPL